MTTPGGDAPARPGAPVLDPGSTLGRVLRAHAATVDPWLRAAQGLGAEPAAVRAALADVVPVADALTATHPAPADDTPTDAPPTPDGPAPDVPGADAVLAVVRTTLDLVARGRWHTGRAQRTAVVQVLPALAPWVRAHPTHVVPAVVAAADVVARTGLLDAWSARLSAAPAPDDAAHVRPALLVAAWRTGLVRYRDAALDAAAALPVALAGPLLGVAPDDVADVLTRHSADRWWWPQVPDGAGVLRRVGGFAAWGGPWVGLPVAVPGGPTGWAVIADGQTWAVVADVHGAGVVPLDDLDLSAAADAPPRPRGAVGWLLAGRAAAPEPALPVPWQDATTGVVPGGPATGDDVVLVSRAHSYALDVLRVPGVPA